MNSNEANLSRLEALLYSGEQDQVELALELMADLDDPSLEEAVLRGSYYDSDRRCLVPGHLLTYRMEDYNSKEDEIRSWLYYAYLQLVCAGTSSAAEALRAQCIDLNLRPPKSRGFERRPPLLKLPASLGSLFNLRNLDLAELRSDYDGSTAIPQEIGRLVNLRSLNLSGNRLRELPAELRGLTNLEALDLSDHALEEVPAVLFDLPALQTVDLSRNDIKRLPSGLERFTSLISIDLSQNEIESVAELKQIPFLRKLIVDGNPWPAGLWDLVGLTTLELSGIDDEGDSVPSHIGDFIGLNELRFENCGLTELPDELWQLPLRSLNLHGNKLSLDAKIGRLRSLECLDVSDCELKALPPEIGDLRKLRELNISGNYQLVRPPELLQLKNITVLKAAGTKAGVSLQQICSLVQLKVLDLSHNGLTAIPQEIGNLSSLVTLRLGSNSLTDFQHLTGLSNLVALDLSQNDLRELPLEVIQLVSLESLDLSGNPLENLPDEIVHLIHLKELSVHETEVTSLPYALLRRLKYLSAEDWSDGMRPAPADPVARRLEELFHASPDSIAEGLNVFSTLADVATEEIVLEGTRYDESDSRLSPGPFFQPIGEGTSREQLGIVCLQLICLGRSAAAQTLRERITSLSLVELRELPSQIARLMNLEVLVASMGQLERLPPEIGELGKLRELNIAANRISSLPAEIGRLSNLTVLNARGNELKEWPEQISNLSSLQALDLSANKLTRIGPGIGRLAALKEFRLAGNDLETLPPEIGNLPLLERLYAPAFERNWKGEAEAPLTQTVLVSVPAEIGALRNLKELNLSGRRLTSLPAEMSRLANLASLRLSQNKLSNLPDVGGLSLLRELDASENRITAMPGGIGRLEKLEEINLSGNKIESLPSEIGGLASLRKVDLSNNAIGSVPPEIGALKSLETLDLRNNRIAELPEEMTRLRNLERSDLRSNRLKELSAYLQSIESRIILSDNEVQIKQKMRKLERQLDGLRRSLHDPSQRMIIHVSVPPGEYYWRSWEEIDPGAVLKVFGADGDPAKSLFAILEIVRRVGGEISGPFGSDPADYFQYNAPHTAENVRFLGFLDTMRSGGDNKDQYFIADFKVIVPRANMDEVIKAIAMTVDPRFVEILPVPGRGNESEEEEVEDEEVEDEGLASPIKNDADSAGIVLRPDTSVSAISATSSHESFSGSGQAAAEDFLRVCLTRRLPDIHHESQVPADLVEYGRFGVTDRETQFVSPVQSSHPSNTKFGGYYAIGRNGFLYLSPRGASLHFGDDSELLDAMIRLVAEKTGLKRRYRKFKIVPDG